MKQNFTRLLLGFISFSVTWSLSGCKRTPDLTKEEVYNILNEIIADDSLRLYTVCWQFDSLPISNNYGFNDRDKEFITRQKVVFRNFKIEPNKLKSYSRRKKVFDFIDIDTTCDAGVISRLSFPLISADRQRVVIENTEDCHFMLGGRGSKDLYVKRSGHWRREKSFDQWISRLNFTDASAKLAQQATSGFAKYGR